MFALEFFRYPLQIETVPVTEVVIGITTDTTAGSTAMTRTPAYTRALRKFAVMVSTRIAMVQI
jgi:hypothetical protein